MQLVVVDSIMGSGKTTEAITHILNSPNEQRFVYVTPFLKEVDRIQTACKEKQFITPVDGTQSKSAQLLSLLWANKNVVITHELFDRFDDATRSIIKEQGNYTLIYDETPHAVEQYNQIGQKDLQYLLRNKTIEVDEQTGLVRYIDDIFPEMLNDLYTYCSEQRLYSINNNLLITCNLNSFECFAEVYMLTYLFNGSLFKGVCDMHKVAYRTKNVSNKAQSIHPSDFKDLINICDNGKYNQIGDEFYDLSYNWYKDHLPADAGKLKNNMRAFMRYGVGTDNYGSAMWTTFKPYQKLLETHGFKQNFLPCNSRATNAYIDKTAACYMVNRFVNPNYLPLFTGNQVQINSRDYAISEMIQWLFRSCVRNHQKVDLYIPSSRMRNLLIDWLNSDD